MTIQMEIEMVLVERGAKLCVYAEMVDVESGVRKLHRPLCIQSLAFGDDIPEIVTVRVEISSNPKPALEAQPAGNSLPPTTA